MQCDDPISPHLLERATHGDQAALSALICTRKERVYQLVVALREGALESELASDVTASMEELADACARSVGLTCLPARPRAHFDSSSPGRVSASERARDGRPVLARQTLLRRWHLVRELCRAVALLTHEQRSVLVLVDMEGLQIDQVAWLVGLGEVETLEHLRAAHDYLRMSLFAGKRDDRQSA